VEKLAADLLEVPWRLSGRESAVIAAALEQLDGERVQLARLFLDFDPVNVLVTPDNAVVLIDAPDRNVVSFVEWDLATFLLGIARAAWPRPCYSAALRRWRDALGNEFRAGYAAKCWGGGRAGTELLIALSGLMRVAQLWMWWLSPFEFRYRLEGTARAIYGYPMLQLARHRLVRTLERLLANSTP